VPLIFLTREATQEMKKAMVDMPKRVDRGRQLFLLEMARVMRRHIRNLAPKVKVGGEPTVYARDLRIGIVEGVKDGDAVALWYEDTQVEVTESDAGNTMLFFRALPTSPKWVNVLIRYGPWPAEILPVHVGREHAKIVSRRARPDEVAAISKRLYDRRGEIEALLGAAGAQNPTIKRSGKGVGLVVREDVGYNVLRKRVWDGRGEAGVTLAPCVAGDHGGVEDRGAEVFAVLGDWA